jgi:sorbitol-specific phosphotransferase system component IIA
LQAERAYALQNGDEIRFGDRRFFVKAIDDQA